MRRRIAAGFALLGMLLALPRDTDREEAPPASRPADETPAATTHEPRFAPHPAADPVPMDPPPEVRVREVAALRVLAEVTGRYVVGCPEVTELSNHTYTHPGLRSAPSPTGGGFYAMVEEPSGVIEVRERHEQLVDGVVHDVGPSDVLAVLRWRTDAAGVTTCTQEEPSPRTVRVLVLDEDGQPLEGAIVHPWYGFEERAVSGSDGWATLRVYSDDPIWIIASDDPDASEAAWVGPADPPATLVVPRSGRSADEAWAESELRRKVQQADARRELAAVLAQPGLDPAVAAVLARWDEELALGTRSVPLAP